MRWLFFLKYLNKRLKIYFFFKLVTCLNKSFLFFDLLPIIKQSKKNLSKFKIILKDLFLKMKFKKIIIFSVRLTSSINIGNLFDLSKIKKNY